MEDLVNLNEWKYGQPLANFTPAEGTTNKDALSVLQAHKSKSGFKISCVASNLMSFLRARLICVKNVDIRPGIRPLCI